MSDVQRELTRKEKEAIRKLVVRECANYDREYGCLPLDWECYMLGKCYTGSLCKYFRESVLPLNPSLEEILSGKQGNRICDYCGKSYEGNHKRRYCSDVCAKAGASRKVAERMRKYRKRKG